MFATPVVGSASDVAAWLERFATSPLYRELAAAQTTQRNVEFLVERSVVIRGVVDCIWQDAQNGWHLLDFVTEPVFAEERRRFQDARRQSLALAAAAFQQQNKVAPQSATLFFFEDGETVRWTARQLQPAQALGEADAAVSALARQSLSD